MWAMARGTDAISARPSPEAPPSGHNYIGHTYKGHNYIGHTDIGHNFIGRTYKGHNYIGYTDIGHNFIGHFYIGHDKERGRGIRRRSPRAPPSATTI